MIYEVGRAKYGKVTIANSDAAGTPISTTRSTRPGAP